MTLFVADLYRVTAGQSALRSYATKKAAATYARQVVAQSHQNIGPVFVEGRDGITGDWHQIVCVGTPTNTR